MDYLDDACQSSNSKPNEPIPKRKRITYRPKAPNAIEDPLELRPNKSSVKARRVFITVENITIELWFDKHYLDRYQHGDEDGKRQGIGYDIVEDLVRRSVKHMLTYSTIVKGFNFLNQNHQQHERPYRVVLQEQSIFGQLNVVIEAHFLDLNRFELTVKTAMCKDDFRLNDNEYLIELTDSGSILKRCEIKSIKEVCCI